MKAFIIVIVGVITADDRTFSDFTVFFKQNRFLQSEQGVKTQLFRSFIVNLPNSITMSRIVMIPLLLWILTPHFPWHAHGAQEITASVLFVLASITDGLDGYLARKRGRSPPWACCWTPSPTRSW